jgi:glycosyltransferase involved in cell wall biosynthesis
MNSGLINSSEETCQTIDRAEIAVGRLSAIVPGQGGLNSGMVAVNGRFRVHEMTGLQRYAEELVSRMKTRLRVIEPSRRLTGAAGHAWEQFALPLRARNSLLWSPCNFGPIHCARHVVTLHDVFPLDFPEWFSPNFARVFRYVVTRLVRRAQRVIAVSEYTRSRILAAVPEASDKVVVVHSGISSRFSPHVDVSVLSAGTLPQDYLLSVSSLQPRKNMRILLKAWERALPELPDGMWLVIAGAQGSSSVFRDLHLGDLPERVMLTGYFPDEFLPALYARARAFVFPSLAEGFGFPPLEAMACGTPVLTSNTSSLAELTGNAAYLVDPKDVDCIALGMRSLSTDDYLCSSLRTRGFAQVQPFRWEITADKTWDILEEQLVAALDRPIGSRILQKTSR